MNLQLRDGSWHNILGYRILERAEATHAIAPAPQSGAYIEEVLSSGPPLPAWHF
jgi:acid phosphatase class B